MSILGCKGRHLLLRNKEYPIFFSEGAYFTHFSASQPIDIGFNILSLCKFLIINVINIVNYGKLQGIRFGEHERDVR